GPARTVAATPLLANPRPGLVPYRSAIRVDRVRETSLATPHHTGASRPWESLRARLLRPGRMAGILESTGPGCANGGSAPAWPPSIPRLPGKVPGAGLLIFRPSGNGSEEYHRTLER